ncbi:MULTISPECIES: catalase [unclassified Sporosarcina]|uniref:catalase n=1 Tax=unclassified Sporosarcina TaxID=2647733 RepID=UPI000C16CC61|nr:MULTISPECIES: catalase [unclassified Sporosarcina]PID05574.1 catalase [Sporosarcina sp. P30]PID08768.1 catalase [Sporosarcina sp. P31]PID11940.1 catalase [Sporosarcina sp. P32b]
MNNQNPLTAKEAIDSIESALHTESTLRRAHATGVAFDATFQPTGAAIPWSTAAHLQQTEVSAVVRFSHSSTSSKPNERLNPVKGMAVRFQLADGTFTNLTMVNVPIFISKTPEAFIRLIQAFDSSSTWSQRIDALIHDTEHKAFASILKELKPFRNFESLHYYSIHAYFLKNDDLERQAVRFEWQPLPQNDLDTASKSMENELIQRVQQGHPVRFRLLMQLAEQGDVTSDPTIAWPNDRKKIEAGILTLNSLRSDNAESLVFDPTVTIEGIECSDDPVLLFRSAAYEESAKRRGVNKDD